LTLPFSPFDQLSFPPNPPFLLTPVRPADVCLLA